MNFKDSFSNKTILIPLLQRDYVQGSNESVIGPFLDYLLKQDCDLNYIYGYSENEAFVPVDGQQRLTTLWLLYLYVHAYVHARKQIPFTTELRFNSREFAEDFCKRLKEKLPEVLENIKSEETLDSVITDQSWFIPSWQKNASVRNMLKTLRYIHARICDKDVEKLLAGNGSISFSFLNMDESNQLDDDIYVKMNGRGRPLSQFENLKSWMDEKVQSLSISDAWKYYMDNRWTNTFWRNRNKQQEHPEEIDDEQLHCFANLMVLFHIKYPHFLLQSINEWQEKLREYLELPEATTTDSDEEIISKLLSNLTNGSMPPLIWFDRIELMPKDFFEFAYNGLNRLSEVSEAFGGLKIHCLPDDNAFHTLYNLTMTKASIASSLPMMYALMKAPKSCTDLKDWMRIIRNLVLNSDIKTASILKSVLDSIDAFSESCEKENIYEFIQPEKCKEILKPFNQGQVNEEIRKAKPELSELRETFAELENTRFFEGRIRCMFDFLESDTSLHSNFRNYSKALMTLFNHSNGLNPEFDDEKHYFRRALMTYPPYDYGYWINDAEIWWSFCHDFSGWRNYVRNQRYNTGAIAALLNEYCSNDFDPTTLKVELGKRVEQISSLPKSLVESEKDRPYSYYLIHHPGVWDLLENYKFVRWTGEYNIVMCTSNRGNYSRMELRTYCLYLDYANDKDMIKSYQGWSINKWFHEPSCLYFEKKINLNGNERTIVIDVYFCQSETGYRDCENCFGFDLFARTQGTEMTQQQVTQEVIIDRYSVLIKSLGLKYNAERGRVETINHYSREGIIEILTKVFDYINKH